MIHFSELDDLIDSFKMIQRDKQYLILHVLLCSVNI